MDYSVPVSAGPSLVSRSSRQSSFPSTEKPEHARGLLESWLQEAPSSDESRMTNRGNDGPSKQFFNR
jgi:hypothetical protein